MNLTPLKFVAGLFCLVVWGGFAWASSPPLTAEQAYQQALESPENTVEIRKKQREWLTEAIRLNPRFAKAYSLRAYYARFKPGSFTAVNTEQFQSVLADYTQAIALNPTETAFYAERSEWYDWNQHRDLALKDLLKAIALKEAQSPAVAKNDRTLLEDLYEQAALFYEAEQAWKQAIAYRTRFIDHLLATYQDTEGIGAAYQARGSDYERWGRVDEALVDYSMNATYQGWSCERLGHSIRLHWQQGHFGSVIRLSLRYVLLAGWEACIKLI